MEVYIHEALFVLFQLCFILQLYYLLSNHSRLTRYKPAHTSIAIGMPPPTVPVSVIISARNEARNLTENLPYILQQNYPDYEVVVINDCSTDDSDMILLEIKQEFPHLKIVTITEHERYKTGKKFALTLGIKAAKNEHLLFTDADCKPATLNWITLMAAGFTGSTQIVLGYSPYTRTGNFLNPFIRFETVKTAISYLSAALNGDAYMGIGRNLAYTKSLFFKAKGFASHMHVISGDDDLFVNQNATPGNTSIQIHPDTFTYTDAKTTLAGWFRQKKRHMGVGKLYKNSHRRMLSFDAVSGFLFYVLFILCLVFKFEPFLIIGVFVFRWILQLLVYSKVFKKLDNGDLVWALPFFDMIYYIYLNVFGLIGTFIKTTRWK
ncbi:glycosyltransferase [Mucilaginibacter sp. AK015]|uniref:glycosyltransferase n=1 Tax=Mucilaginibacter sp. AK015 TaxID=2723072 RepID=UPI0018347250|nr:glycosyltransferase [Mucilaginibacter sp. AK015]MBB5397651.1 cellulose synthase/poly-beta-1,6-N-acetylglucosamine synthase-like glycosyltransferase [Mucilaginibacter sp. AK015]